MSYDIRLTEKNGETIDFGFKHTITGGTYQRGGCSEAWLNVTYNYSEILEDKFGDEGIRSIYGMTGLESMPYFETAIAGLGDDRGDSYWDATEGNVKKALRGLLLFAYLCPDGIWAGD